MDISLTPFSDKWKAALIPMTPPPIIITDFGKGLFIVINFDYE